MLDFAVPPITAFPRPQCHPAPSFLSKAKNPGVRDGVLTGSVLSLWYRTRGQHMTSDQPCDQALPAAQEYFETLMTMSTMYPHVRTHCCNSAQYLCPICRFSLKELFEIYEEIKYKVAAPRTEMHIKVIVAALCVRLSVCLQPQRVPIAPSLSMASSMRDGHRADVILAGFLGEALEVLENTGFESCKRFLLRPFAPELVLNPWPNILLWVEIRRTSWPQGRITKASQKDHI